MKNTHFCFLASASFFFAFGGTIIFLQTAFTQQTTYPLHVGDRWEFWSDDVVEHYNHTTIISKDTTLPNGHMYAYLIGDPNHSEQFQRQVGDSIFQFIPGLGEEKLLFNFSASPGDIIAQYPWGGDTTAIMLLGIQTKSIFGRSLRQWDFLIDHMKHAVDDEEYYYVTDSLGLTHIGCFCIPLNLHGAYINGVSYGTITVAVKNQEQAPTSFLLSQNFPNPYNPTSTITFDLPKASHVTLNVYNTLGQLVATLIEEQKQPGRYDVQFDGSNLTSGFYFYRMTAGGFVDTKKMIIMK